MKFVYIDDTYLRDSKFLDTMRKRLFHFCKQKAITHIFISGSCPHRDELSASLFYQECEKRNLLVLQSPCTFEVGNVKGVLHHDALILEDGVRFCTFSGSAIIGDSDHQTFERVYFELFLNHEHKGKMELFEDDLMEAIQEIFGQHKKTKQIYH